VGAKGGDLKKNAEHSVERTYSGALVRRTIDRSHSHVPAHAHDWPVLSLFVMGQYVNHSDLGTSTISAPSAILYREGAIHKNDIASSGFEQIEIEFDPAWIGREALPDAPVAMWRFGWAASATRRFVQLLSRGTTEDGLRQAMRGFIATASHASPPPSPWIMSVTDRLRADPSLTIAGVAMELRRHPSRVGTAYRSATGEGLREAAARFRVERAAQLLRETDLAAALVAAECGFCDQSHMIRSFGHVLHRPPSTVRFERDAFRRHSSLVPASPCS
jgi:AraC family transcriptional regulator